MKGARVAAGGAAPWRGRAPSPAESGDHDAAAAMATVGPLPVGLRLLRQPPAEGTGGQHGMPSVHCRQCRFILEHLSAKETRAW